MDGRPERRVAVLLFAILAGVLLLGLLLVPAAIPLSAATGCASRG